MKPVTRAGSGLALALCIAAGTAWADDAGNRSEPGVVDRVERAVGHGVSAAASGVQRGVKAASRGVKKGAKAAAHGVAVAASATARAANKTANAIGVDTAKSPPPPSTPPPPSN